MFSHFKNILIYFMYLHYSINFMKSKKPCFSVILCIVGEEFHDPLKVIRYSFLQEVWALGTALTTRVCFRVSCGTGKNARVFKSPCGKFKKTNKMNLYCAVCALLRRVSMPLLM